MAITRALRGPDELIAVADEPEIVVEVDPDVGLVDQHERSVSRLDFVAPQLQPPLVARLDLHVEAAIRRPVDAGQVDVVVPAEV